MVSGVVPAECVTDGPDASWKRAVVILGIGIPLWSGPVAAAALLTESDSVFAQQGVLFPGTALVTFGGPLRCWPTCPSRR